MAVSLREYFPVGLWPRWRNRNGGCGAVRTYYLLPVGFKVVLEYNGVGYRAVVSKNFLVLGLGYSHDIVVKIPSDITVTPEKPNLIVIQGEDKGRIGTFASRIISFRTTEPYKGKGIKYQGQEILRKEGKKK